MIIRIKKVVAICLFIFVASCGNSKRQLTSKKNDRAIVDLANKYHAITDWDSTFLYSATYQEMFIDEHRLMLFRGRIYDVIKKDSIYFAKILDEREDSPQNFLAIISITPKQLDRICDSTKSARGGFILEVSKITTSNPSIKVDEGADGEDSYSYTHLSDDRDRMISIFRGKLVDLYLEKLTAN